MAKSGWCTAAPGARIPHERCRSVICGCPCHGENPAQNKGSERFGTVESVAQSGPESAQTDRGLADYLGVDQ